MCTCVCSITQSCPTLCDLMDWSPPTRLLCPWNFPGRNTGVRCHFFSSRDSSQPRDQTWVSCISCIGRWILYHCATWAAQAQSILTHKEYTQEYRHFQSYKAVLVIGAITSVNRVKELYRGLWEYLKW